MRLLIAIAVLCLAAASATPASAAGALAVGVTNNVGKDGIAYGTAWDYKSIDEAGRVAMRNCRNFKSAKRAVAACRLIGTFRKQCFAVAFDPKDNEPGVGWSIAQTKSDAEERALDACRVSSAERRQKFCKIDTVECDVD